MDNIILIGMPGSGKSTVGVLLAKIEGYRFLDTDLLIQETEGKKLYEIIRDHGNDYFRALENRVIASVTADHTVIATGGSAVYGEQAMEHLKTIGTVVYLKVDPGELACRINDLPTRGIVMNQGETIADLYLERAPLYEKYADITVVCNQSDLTQNARRIADAVRNREKIKKL